MSRFLIIGYVTILMGSCAPTKSLNGSFSKKVIACGSATINLLSDDGKEVLRIIFNADGLTNQNTFTLGERDLSASLIKYDNDVSEQLCNDLVPSEPPKINSETIAEKIKIEVTVSDENIKKAQQGIAYRVDLKIISGQFDSGEKIKDLQIEDVLIGWLPG